METVKSALKETRGQVWLQINKFMKKSVMTVWFWIALVIIVVLLLLI